MERRDIFISYTKKDTEQAVWIANVLKSHGYTVYIQQLDIKPGDNFLEKMNEFLKNSDNFLAVWSKAYSKSRFCMTEMQAAFNEWHKGRINGFLPVRIENYAMEPLYAAMVHADLFGMDKTEAEKVLMDAVHSLVSRTEPEPESELISSIWLCARKYILSIVILLICIVMFAGSVRIAWPMLREAYSERLFEAGQRYYYGESDINIDIEKALECYEHAAILGNERALYSLGQYYYEQKDYPQAQKYLEKAANKGHAMAQAIQGKLYYDGYDGMSPDYETALKHLMSAAEKNNPIALYYLYLAYEFGNGVDKNPEKAAEYRDKADEMGYLSYMNIL